MPAETVIDVCLSRCSGNRLNSIGFLSIMGGRESRLNRARNYLEEYEMIQRSLIIMFLGVALMATGTSGAAGQDNAALMNPAGLDETAPDTFKASFDTSAGTFVIEVHRDWAPHGADRFYNLVKAGFFDDCRFFRVISGFMVQFGLNGDPSVSAAWREARIAVDPVKESNRRGYITYAMGGSPDTRTTQLFINFQNNRNLDASGFAPFGRVVDGMSVVNDIYSGYGEGAPRGRGPSQGRIQAEGNAYLNEDFPRLDYINKATIVEE